MTTRWGLGPVFAGESILGARRWPVYAARSVFVLCCWWGMAYVWITVRRRLRVEPGAVR